MGAGNTNTKSLKKKTVAHENQEIQEAIRLKAYEIYLKRNGVAGDEREDWIKAERIVLKKFA